MLAVALSVISAVALSLVTAVATGAIRKGFYKIRSGIDSLRSLGYDVRQDELYCLGDWSPARKLQPSDPAVRAGRLTVEIMTWYCQPGTMSQPGRTVSLP